MADVGIAAQTLLLAAAEQGLGGCMIASFSKTALQEAVDFPAPFEPCLVIALGKPAEQVVLEDCVDDRTGFRMTPQALLKQARSLSIILSVIS